MLGDRGCPVHCGIYPLDARSGSQAVTLPDAPGGKLPLTERIPQDTLSVLRMTQTTRTETPLPRGTGNMMGKRMKVLTSWDSRVEKVVMAMAESSYRFDA